MGPRRLFSESLAMGAQVIHTPICAITWARSFFNLQPLSS